MSDPQRLSEPAAQPAYSSPPSTTAVLERTPQATEVEPGDRERFSHYVQKDRIVESAVTGTPLVALCGKVWVPQRDPQKFPVCPTCREIYESIGSGEPSGDGE